MAEDGDVSKHTDHTGWMAIGTAQELTSITSSGNYYLTGDVTLTENEAWKPADGVVLCLTPCEPVMMSLPNFIFG